MGKITFVTGGARSGKSAYAQNLACGYPGTTVFIATAMPFDEGMKERIRRHRQQRPNEWKTIEGYKDFDKLLGTRDFTEADNALVDCLTLMATNQLMEMDVDWDNAGIPQLNEVEEKVNGELESLLKLLKNKNSIIVSNEIGMGVAPANALGNFFRDLMGRVNQKVAAMADEVVLTVSGIPVKVK